MSVVPQPTGEISTVATPVLSAPQPSASAAVVTNPQPATTQTERAPASEPAPNPKPTPELSGQTFNCQMPIPTLKDEMIRESIARYPGNCPCPYNRDARGHNCGKRSAWNRGGGYEPLCFPEDISADMTREYCEVLKMRRQPING